MLKHVHLSTSHETRSTVSNFKLELACQCSLGVRTLILNDCRPVMSIWCPNCHAENSFLTHSLVSEPCYSGPDSRSTLDWIHLHFIIHLGCVLTTLLHQHRTACKFSVLPPSKLGQLTLAITISIPCDSRTQPPCFLLGFHSLVTVRRILITYVHGPHFGELHT
jgi:hypothetical protein